MAIHRAGTSPTVVFPTKLVVSVPPAEMILAAAVSEDEGVRSQYAAFPGTAGARN